MTTLTLDNQTYTILAEGHFCQTIIWAEDLIAKVFYSEVDAYWEYDALIECNEINNLLPQAVELIQIEDAYLLVMERLDSISNFTDIPIEDREIMVQEFEETVKELHFEGICHGDIMRPYGVDDYWANIFITTEGIRLVDIGMVYYYDEPDQLQFKEKCRKDLEDISEFANYFLFE